MQHSRSTIHARPALRRSTPVWWWPLVAGEGYETPPGERKPRENKSNPRSRFRSSRSPDTHSATPTPVAAEPGDFRCAPTLSHGAELDGADEGLKRSRSFGHSARIDASAG